MPRKLVAAAAGVILSLVLAGPALAEGYFETYLSGARVWFSSRSWTDYNNDDHGTKIRFDNCRDAIGTQSNDSAKVQLTRKRTALPDVNMGQKTLECYWTDTEDWGDVQAAAYHFTIVEITGTTASWQHLDAKPVRVYY